MISRIRVIKRRAKALPCGLTVQRAEERHIMRERHDRLLQMAMRIMECYARQV